MLDFELAIRQDWTSKGGKFDVKAPLRLAGAKTRFMSPELYVADEFHTKIDIGPGSDLWCVLATRDGRMIATAPFQTLFSSFHACALQSRVNQSTFT